MRKWFDFGGGRIEWMRSCDFFHYQTLAVFLFETHPQALMLAGIAFTEERTHALIELAYRFIAVDEDVVTFHSALEPLDNYVVHCSAIVMVLLRVSTFAACS